MKVIFITSGKINYSLPGLDLYNSIKSTAKGDQFPHLSHDTVTEVEDFAKQFQGKGKTVIFSAPSEQARETANILASVLETEVISDTRFLPLRFELKSIISKEEFENLGDKSFKVLRERFLENFYNDKLIDERLEIKKRIENFAKLIKNNYQDYQVIVISHAYLIKLFYIYQIIGDEMFKNKEKLVTLFNPSQEPLGRLEKVEIEL